jgi:excisionase family DNA binding protein
VSDELRIALPPETIETIAQRAAEIVLQRQKADAALPRWLTVEKAADYIGATRQRVYDLRSDGRLTKHGDGSRALVDRLELDALIERGRGS